MEKLKNLPIGIQNFEKVRSGDYLYIDKTAYMYQLANSGCYYFLARPRRFGKSMLLSTLHAYFEGKKELFEGLAISQLEKNWTRYPILHLDLNIGEYNTESALTEKLNLQLCEWEAIYGNYDAEKSLGDRFAGVIKRAAIKCGQPVVILVDEYDKPILQSVDNETLQDSYRSTLKSFYGAMKSMDEHIRFALLSGITRFGKVSIFSDLNNMTDISMINEYAAICGITDDELDTVLKPYTLRLAKNEGRTYDDVRQELRERYDGYRFMRESPAIYNPFSVLSTLQFGTFKNYWFETGTPSYLVYLLKKHNYDLHRIEEVEVGERVLSNIDAQPQNPIPLIYQSGYLTIKGYNARFKTYKLGFPNAEVEEGFLSFLLPYYTPIADTDTEFNIQRFVTEIEGGKVDEFMQRMRSFLADTPYELVRDFENHYQNVFFIVTRLLGFYVKAEYHTSKGRIDMVLQTANYTYVIEYKLDGTAEEALAQIHEKEYSLPFNCNGRKLKLIGVNISSTTRNIERWIVEDGI
jgi:hypothetical protein